MPELRLGRASPSGKHVARLVPAYARFSLRPRLQSLQRLFSFSAEGFLMPVQISCPQCSQTLRVPDTAVGKSVRCPKCQTVFPAKPSGPPPAPPADPFGAPASKQPAADPFGAPAPKPPAADP